MTREEIFRGVLNAIRNGQYAIRDARFVRDWRGDDVMVTIMEGEYLGLFAGVVDCAEMTFEAVAAEITEELLRRIEEAGLVVGD